MPRGFSFCFVGGLRSYKAAMPALPTDMALLSYGITDDAVALTFALDLDNFTDADNYDFFGIHFFWLVLMPLELAAQF